MRTLMLWGSGFVASLALIQLSILPAPKPDQFAGALVLLASIVLAAIVKTSGK